MSSPRLASATLALFALLSLAFGAGAENYSDIWWNPAESGWGLTIADHETQLFAVWYTYQADGSPTWFVIPGGAFSADRRFFTGDLYRTSGPSYAGPFDPSQVAVDKAGSATFDFAPPGLAAGTALFTWTVGSTTQTKQIQRQPFGNATAAWGSDDTDLWWNPTESGWGLSLAQHGNNIFGVWYTYGTSGQPLFVVLPGVTFSAPDTFSGTLYTTTGPAYASSVFDPTRVKVTPVGSATIRISGGSGTFTSTVNGFTQTKDIVPQPFGLALSSAPPIGKYLLSARGVWAVFDRRGWANGYFSGDLIHWLGQFDQDLANNVGPAGNVAPTVGAEASAQLAKMQAMGVNTITFELRATDPTYVPGFTPPTCNIPPALGLLWPQPTPTELANLRAFLDLAQAHGTRVILVLNSTHLEEQPPTNAAQWLGAILGAVKDHPAIYSFVFGGDAHVLTNPDGSTRCGIPAEAPLWLGPDSYAGKYVRWAIDYGRSLGVAPQKLSAEAVVGNYYVDTQPPAGSDATGNHLWSTIAVLKQIFDELGIDPAQRTYALSFYSHRKCLNVNNFVGIPCTDADPDTWADQTLQNIVGTVGSGSRIVAVEFGDMAPFAPGWGAPLAFESLAKVFAKYGIDGGAYWIWTETDDTTDADPAHPGEAVRRRGISDVFNPVQRELAAAYGFHLAPIPNASFEDGDAMPANWTASGSGTASRYRLANEPGEPAIASRGSYVLRLVSGSGASDALGAQSDAISVSPATSYTTAANLRFQWSRDPRVGFADPSRPNVFIGLRYFRLDGSPSWVRAEDDFHFYQEDVPVDFGTFPVTYTTPVDAHTVRIVFGVERNGLAQPITLDVDNVR